MSDHTTIFEEKWWYQAATDGKWQQIEYTDGRSSNATLIFAKRQVRGSTIIGMPAMARVMQPKISFESNRPKEYVSDSVNAIRGLSALLPKFDQFKYTLPPELEARYCVQSGWLLRGRELHVSHRPER